MNRAAPLLFLLPGLVACRWLGPTDWDRWQKEQGILPWDSSDTGWRDSGSGGGDDPPVDPDCSEISIPMVQVEAGSFEMGSPSTEPGREGDEVRHSVHLSHDFCIGVTEVTQDQYAAYVDENPAYFDDCGGDCPLEMVSWHQAAAFANTVSESAGLAPCYDCTVESAGTECEPTGSPYTCEGYRLPTEAEWEYAARAGSEACFTDGGDIVDGTEGSCTEGLELDNGTVIADLAWYCNVDGTDTKVTGRLEPNAWGLYDVHGNVSEWCHDGYDDYPEGSTTDPYGSDAESTKVHRGGQWAVDPEDLRLASRATADAGSRMYTRGIRLARSP